MKRAIVGFTQDQFGDWVAELSCGHRQHMRHHPPFAERTWVTSAEGRAGKVGHMIECMPCDRLQWPDGLTAYSETPQFTKDTVPGGLLKDHSTKAGVWGRLEVEAGEVCYVVSTPVSQSFLLTRGDSAAIAPEILHRVELSEDASFKVVFLRRTG